MENKSQYEMIVDVMLQMIAICERRQTVNISI